MYTPLPADYDFFIEPESPIQTPREFTNELVNHFSKEGKSISMREESMEPIIEVDGNTYVCRLGEPSQPIRFFHVPLRPKSARFLGFQFIYLYRQ